MKNIKSRLYDLYVNLPFPIKLYVRYAFSRFESITGGFGSKDFPLIHNLGSAIGRCVSGRLGEKHYVFYYKEDLIDDSSANLRMLSRYRYELLVANLHVNGIHMVYQSDDAVVLPICFPFAKASNYISHQADVTVLANGNTHEIGNLVANRFHYLPLKPKEIVELRTARPTVLGRPLVVRKSRVTTKGRLNLVIAIDGLSSMVFPGGDYSVLMPNAWSFFKASRASEFVSCAEWTVPSFVSVVTGTSTIQHLFVDSTGELSPSDRESALQSVFSDKGYMTTMISSNYGVGLASGHVSGFDRVVYKKNAYAEELVSDVIEHIESFCFRDNYIFINLMDLHHFLPHKQNLSEQVSTSLPSLDCRSSGGSGVHAKFDHKRCERYKRAIIRLDLTLSALYSYIERVYDRERVSIIITSDHGQSYLDKNTHPLSRSRTQVPVISLPSLKPGPANHIGSLADLRNIILSSEFNSFKVRTPNMTPNISSRVSVRGRNFVVSESIFRRRPYRVVFITGDVRIYYETLDVFSANFEMKRLDFDKPIIKDHLDNLSNKGSYDSFLPLLGSVALERLSQFIEKYEGKK